MIDQNKTKQLIQDLKKTYPNFGIKKTSVGDKIYITLPPKVEYVPVYKDYTDNVELLERTVLLAQRLATSMVREVVDGLIDKISDKLSQSLINALKDKIPTQSMVIHQTAQEVLPKAKQELKYEEYSIPVNYGGGLELVGSTGDSVKKQDNIDDNLSKLKGLDLNRQK